MDTYHPAERMQQVFLVFSPEFSESYLFPLLFCTVFCPIKHCKNLICVRTNIASITFEDLKEKIVAKENFIQ